MPHINIYSTNCKSVLHFDCLRVTAFADQTHRNRHIISYCIDEYLSEFHIEETNLLPKFTFSELVKKNITSEQLYFWSAPIDTVEQYQFYLNERLVTSHEIFSNCTLPRFGSMCQYEFDYYQPNHLSL